MTLLEPMSAVPAASRSARPEPLSDDLQRLWNDVFDRSRVVAADTSGDADAASSRRSAVAEAAVLSRPDGRRGAAAAASEVHGPGRAALAPGARPCMPIGAPALTTLPVAVAPRRADGGVVPAALGLSTRAMPRRLPAAVPAIAAPTPTLSAAPLPAEEAVQVFRDGRAVSIVVRDLALDERAAVRCALETARQLTGDAGALRHVTLNGRRVYDGPAPAEPTARRAVSFTC